MRNPFDPGFYSELDLCDAGFKKLGKDVKIDKTCTIFGLENIEIGNNVRIDAYATLNAEKNGFIRIGSNIHIGAYSILSAGAGIVVQDFSGLSQGVRIYSSTDDYSGHYLTNPTIPEEYKDVFCGTVTLGRHVIIGSGSVILPRLTIGEGCAVGALSLVTKNLDEWGIYFGSPVKRLKGRSNELLVKEKKFLEEAEH